MAGHRANLRDGPDVFNRSNPNIMTRKANLYRAQYDMQDGRHFTYEFYCKIWPSSWEQPEEVEISGHQYFIDGEYVAENDLPQEITDNLLDGLEETAIMVRDQ